MQARELAVGEAWLSRSPTQEGKRQNPRQETGEGRSGARHWHGAGHEDGVQTNPQMTRPNREGPRSASLWKECAEQKEQGSGEELSLKPTT